MINNYLVSKLRVKEIIIYISVFIQDLMKPDQETVKEDMRELKAQREQELHAKDALYTLLFYAIFMFVIYSVSYIERDQRSYHLKQNIYQQLFGNNTLSKVTLLTSRQYNFTFYSFHDGDFQSFKRNNSNIFFKIINIRLRILCDNFIFQS